MEYVRDQNQNPIDLAIKDLYTKEWLPGKIRYQNTLLGYLFPDTRFVIGKANLCLELEGEKHAAKVIDKGWDDEEGKWRIVGASGSRKKSYSIFSNSNYDCFEKFFGSNSNCINYGSNLVTECIKIVDIVCTLIVVPDGQFGTGDCHGKATQAIFEQLKLESDRAIQFRAVKHDKDSWLAKGTFTLLQHPVKEKNVLVLPESSFKGNKVNPGTYKELTLSIGVKEQGIRRKAHWSHTAIQWLSWEAVQQDILPNALERLRELRGCFYDYRAFLKFLESKLNIEDDEQLNLNLNRIAKADVWNQLDRHPWVGNKIAFLIQKTLLKLSMSGGEILESFMMIPDDSIPFGVVCCPDLIKESQNSRLIALRYPLRYWEDITLVKNIHLKKWMGFKGIVLMSHQTALELFSGDFDGDYLCLARAWQYPNIVKDIENFKHKYKGLEVDRKKLKPEKQKLNCSKGQLVVLSASNDIGLLSWIISKANATNNLHLVPELVVQMQLAVDCLKGAPRPDANVIRKASASMKKQSVSWLTRYKDDQVFISKSLIGDRPNFGKIDTIYELASAIDSVWKDEIKLTYAQLRSFDYIFKCDNDIPELLEWAKEFASAYSTNLKIINEACGKNKELFRKLLVTLIDDFKLSVEEAIEFWGGENVASYLWKINHNGNSSSSRKTTATGGLPFTFVSDFIVEQIKQLRFSGGKIFACNEEIAVEELDGQVFNVVVEKDLQGKNIWVRSNPPIFLGHVEKSTPTIGMKVKLYGHYTKNKKPLISYEVIPEEELDF